MENVIAQRVAVRCIVWLDRSTVDVGVSIVPPSAGFTPDKNPSLAIRFLEQSHLIVVDDSHHGSSEMPRASPFSAEILSSGDGFAYVALRHGGLRTGNGNACNAW